jgi:outer membrane assembly lipoprotein YfiO
MKAMKNHSSPAAIAKSRSNRLSLVSAFVVLGTLLGGCSSKPATEPEPAEIPLGDVTAVDTPEEQLFAEAKNYYATELYTVARESFKSLAASYALGAYAEFAEIKAADAYFEMNEFDTARGMYEEFMKSRPASSSLPYVTLRAGRSFHLSHRGIGRDPQSLERALELYDALIARYPNSVYADAARGYRSEVIRDLESSERVVADFYARRNNQRAVAARQEAIGQKWTPLLTVAAATTPQGLEVARYMPEMAVPLPPATVITPAKGAQLANQSGHDEIDIPGVKIVRAVCKEGPPEQIFLHLSDTPPPGAAGATTIAALNGEIRLQLDGVSSKGLSLDCFSRGDLGITPNGAVSLKSSARGASVRILQNPTRVLVLLNR